ncbi:hypothetical protein F0562_019489 [Nyssa sinensis]|uniref:HAT C-terminal dimerisation domain-containing protein n=2 Tax=Magnoliopsida TaxID=3398 RepID=A0A5J5BPT9_9ASTE|nr:hypothetical protein F0562_019489 [Nyssa sinensis]
MEAINIDNEDDDIEVSIELTNRRSIDCAEQESEKDVQTSKVKKCHRKLTSEVWSFFDLLPLDSDGKQKSIAVIFDPRYKIQFIEFSFNKLYGDGSNQLTHVRNKLFSLFDEYMHKSSKGSSSSSFTSQYGAHSHGSDHEKDDIDFIKEFETFESQEFMSSAQKTQLELYLLEPKIKSEGTFDVLAYWKAHQYRYPVLAQMARDILTIPISTVASESAFSVGGRVLDQYRSSLRPDIVEALVCTRDWLYGEGASQVNSNDLTEDIINLNINKDEDGSAECSNEVDLFSENIPSASPQIRKHRPRGGLLEENIMKQSKDPFEVAFVEQEESPPDSPIETQILAEQVAVNDLEDDDIDTDSRTTKPSTSTSASISTGTAIPTSKTKEEDEEEEDENMDVELGKFPPSGDPDKMTKMQAILSQFTEEQMSRYESFRRSGFQKANMKRLLASITGSAKISVPMTIVVSGIAKMFIGELVETARMIDLEATLWWTFSGKLFNVAEVRRKDWSIISLEDTFPQQPDGSEIPLEIVNSSRFYPYFKNCVGAIDGTHVRVKVSNEDAPRYRGRKNYPTQNVLAACSFDLRFTYILPGWEGTAVDSRIIKNALTRDDNLKIPNGKYYLVDAGYMLRSGLIAPYRGVRYHLKEYTKHRPENPRELFNLRHASLRNAIERAFGVLKKQFPIIGSTTEPTYSVETQSEIILACCILHNYLMGVDPDEGIINEVDQELLNQPPDEEEVHASMEVDEDATRGEYIRDSIAISMWNDYVVDQMQNPMLKNRRTTPIKHYDKLSEMFAKDRATGAGAETAKEKRRRWVSSTSEDPLESIHNIDQLVSQNEVTLENFICDLDDDMENITSPKTPSSVPSQSATSKTKNKKMRYDDEKDVQMVKAIESVAEAIKEGNAIYEKYHQPIYSEKEVYNELTAIGVQEFLFDDAYLYLTSHPDRMRQFLGCPFERRKGILERMMQS